MIKLCIFLKGMFLKNLLKKLTKIKWKISSKCLKTGSVIIPKFNTNLYSVARIIVFKIEKNSSTTISVLAQKSFVLQMGENSAITWLKNQKFCIWFRCKIFGVLPHFESQSILKTETAIQILLAYHKNLIRNINKNIIIIS